MEQLEQLKQFADGLFNDIRTDLSLEDKEKPVQLMHCVEFVIKHFLEQHNFYCKFFSIDFNSEGTFSDFIVCDEKPIPQWSTSGLTDFLTRIYIICSTAGIIITKLSLACNNKPGEFPWLVTWETTHNVKK